MIKMHRKNKRKKIFKLFIVFLIPLMLTGCFDYHDINKMSFATSIIFDTDELNQVVLYIDCIKAYRSSNESSDKGRRLIFKGTGKTTEEALAQINNVSGNELNYSQIRAYIFTEKAAKKGIKKYLDLINNYGQMQIKPSAFIYYGDVEELIKATSNDEEYLGMHLNDLISKSYTNKKSSKSNINSYLSDRLQGNSSLLLPAITLKTDIIHKKIQVDGAGILKDNVLIDKLDQNDMLMYKIMMGDIEDGILEIGNPNTKESFIILDILESSEHTALEFNGKNLVLVKNIEMDLEIADIQGTAIVNKELLNYIKSNEKAFVEGYIEYLFNKYKEKNIDIFNLSRMKEIYYGEEEIENPLGMCDINVKAKININGSGLSKNTL